MNLNEKGSGNLVFAIGWQEISREWQGHFYYYCYLVARKRAEKKGKHICEILKAMLEGLDFILYRAGNESGP